MNDVERELIGCFAATFPNRSEEEIRTATRDSFAEWDSLAAITLLTLIQQEFQIDVDLTDLDELGSFAAVLQYVEVRLEPV